MVASIAELTSAATSVAYYARDGLVAEDDPDHRLASSWHGRAAAGLGLAGPVEAEPFGSVLRGHVPGTGLRLGAVRQGVHRHRPGIDLVLSAPKSVALEALLEGDDRVIDAHRRAVDETLDWIEGRLLETRAFDPQTGRRPRTEADGMIAATFRHAVSRNRDPQVHTHCVIANMTRTAAAAWRPVDPTSLRRNRLLIGAVYRNALAAALHDLGFALAPTMIGRVPGFEIAGYDQAFLDAFSSRRRDILRHLDRLGIPRTPRATGLAALVTRRPKSDRPLAALMPEWKARARDLGLARAAVPATGRQPPDAPMPDRSMTRIVCHAVEYLESRASAFSRSELVAVALGHAPGRHSPAAAGAAVAALLRDGHLVATRMRGADRAFTTPAVLEAEARLAAWAGLETGIALAGREALAESARSLDARSREALTALAFTRRHAAALRLAPDESRFPLLRRLADLARGRPLAGLAATPADARDLERNAGIPSTTFRAFLESRADMPAGGLLVVDGASRLPAIELAALAARQRAARVVLVADTGPATSPGPPQGLRLMEDAGMPVADGAAPLDLMETVRLIHPLAAAAGAKPVIEVDHDRLADEAARIWHALPGEARAATAILAATPELTSDIHDALGGLDGGRARITIDRLVDRRMTRPQLADAANYHEGDVILFRRDVHGCRRGALTTVTGAEGGMVQHRDAAGRLHALRPSAGTFRNLALHDTAAFSLAAGDRVRLPLRAGSARRAAVVSAVAPGEVHLLLARGRTLRLEPGDRRARFLEPEWSVPGRRHRSAIVVLDSGEPAGQGPFADRTVRACGDCIVITDNRDDPALAQVLGHDVAAAPGERPLLRGSGDDRARHARTVARIEAHIRYWPEIRFAGGPRLLEAWRSHAGRLLEEGRAVAAGDAVRCLENLCRRDRTLALPGAVRRNPRPAIAPRRAPGIRPRREGTGISP